MVYEVVWSELAIKSYINNIKYLEKNWTKKEVTFFILSVKRRIQLLSSAPETGLLTNKRKNVRKTVIHKRVILFYRFNKRKKLIELIRFWETRQNPGMLSY